MSSSERLKALPSVDGDRADSFEDQILSEIPDIPAKLTTKEKKIWAHVAEALKEYNLIHRTDGLTLTVICKTFCAWVDAEEELEKFRKENGNSYIIESGNGYRSPHPIYYVARNLKKELKDWLPEAALTIPSFQKIKGEKANDSGQGQLFDDPIDAYRKRKTAANVRLVGGNG